MPIETGVVLFTSAEAAEYIGRSIESIRKYVQRGQLTPCELKVGVSNLFTKFELDRFLKHKRSPGRPRKIG